MTYYLFFLQFFLALMALFLLWKNIVYFQNMRLVKRLKATPFPQNYEAVLMQVPHYRQVPQQIKEKLHFFIRLFIETKEFKGVKMEITDEVKVIIAFFACLMNVNRENACYEALETIIVYPDHFIVDVETREKWVLDGQSANGTVVIAWNEARKEAYDPNGHNVIIHEFAHELDFENGAADGVPPLTYRKYKVWASIMFEEYKKLNMLIETGQDLEKYQMIGTYAASNEAEFFAVISELFFENPKQLKEKFPNIYAQLRDFYAIDSEKLLQVS